MSNPCPEGNGTTIGTQQQFTLQCDSRLFGDTIGSQDADSFLQCVDLCSSFHPKCEGVVFNRRTCDFKGNIRRDGDSRRFDAAVATFPKATSGCRTLGDKAAAGNKNYDLSCGKIIAGNDISQAFAPTMLDCMGQCSNTNGCAAVSFDASLDQGFKNCYLKNGDGTGPVAQDGIDTAVLNNAVVAADPSPNPAPATTAAPVTVAPATTVAPVTVAPATTVVPASIVPSSAAPSIAPLPATTLTPATSAAGVTFATLSASASVPPASVRTQTLVSVITSVQLSVTQFLSTTRVATVPVGFDTLSTMSALETGATATTLAAETAGPTSQAWIAAPVVGSVAAVTVVAVAFVLWGRRSRRRGSSSAGVMDRLPFVRTRSEPGTPRSTISRGGGQFWGNSWRVQRRKPLDEESDRSVPVSRAGPTQPASRAGPTPAMPEMAAAESGLSTTAPRPHQGSAMDGIPAFLRE